MLFNKKLWILIIALAVLLIACSTDEVEEEETIDPDLSTDEMVEKMLNEVEQPELMELNAEQIEDFYGVDMEKIEEYTVRVPMMNVKTNEVSIFKVKEIEEIESVEHSVKQRAEDVQKQFENNLPDQYENAKNFMIKTKGKYISFVISEDADVLMDVYKQFFEED